MAVDFTKYRVDVDNALGQAISSRDTNAVQTETTNTAIQARSRALSEAGQAIGKGLTEAFDPTKDLARQTALRNSQAQQADLARQNAGLAIRSQASYQKPSAILGTDLSNKADIAEKIVDHKSPGGVPYRELPPDMRQRFEGRIGEITDTDMLVNKASDKDVLALGAEYGSEKNVGLTTSRAKQRLTELGDAAYEEMTKDPAYQKLMLEVNARRQKQADAHSKGDWVLEQGIKDHPEDKQLQEKFVPFSNAIRSDEVVMTPMGPMTLLQFVARNGGTVAGWHQMMRSTVDQYPAMAIEGDGDKATVSQTWDEKVVKRAAAKDTEDEPLAKALSGRPMGEAYSKWSGIQGSKAALGELTDEKADFRSRLKGPQSQLLIGKLNALKGHIDKYGLAAVAAEVGNLSGVAELPEGTMQKANVFGKKGSMLAVRNNLAAIKALSPDAKSLLTKSLDPSKPSQLELLTSKAYQDGMAKGPFDAGPGPMAPFKNAGIHETDLAVMSESVITGVASRPEFGLLQQHLQFGGIPAESARRLATENLPEFQSAMERGFTTPDKNGVMPDKWPKAEQDGLRNDIAEDFARLHIHEYTSARDSENSEMMNWLANKPDGQLPYNDAVSIANDALKAHPDYANKSVDLAQKDGGAIRLHRGDPIAQRLPDGQWVKLKDPDPYQQRYTEALHMGSKNYELRLDEAKKRGNATPGKGTSGDPRIDAIMNESMPGGGSVYDYASNLLNQHPHMGSKSDEWGSSIATHLNNRGAAQGFKSFDLSKAFNDAAQRTRDPVLEGISTFIAESLSPQPNTRKDLDMIEGHDPTDLIRSAGEAQAEEQAQKGQGTAPKESAAQFLNKNVEAAASRPTEKKPPRDWSYPEDPEYQKSWQETEDERTARGDPDFNPTSTGVGAGVGVIGGPPGMALLGGVAAAAESDRVKSVEEARARIDTAQKKAAYEKRFGPGTWESGGSPESRPEPKTGQEAKGIITPGNIDLTKRPIAKWRDGTIATVRTISIGTDQGEVLIPTVVGEPGKKAKILTNEEAIEHYKKTGEHFGVFETRRDADRYAQQLHESQARMYGPKEKEQAPESRPESRPESSPESKPAAPPTQEDPFTEMLRKATTRAEQIRRGEKPDAEAPGRSRFLGPRAESRPSTTPPREEQAKIHAQAMTRRFGEAAARPASRPSTGEASVRREESQSIYERAAGEAERRRASAQQQIDRNRIETKLQALNAESRPTAEQEQERQRLLREYDSMTGTPGILKEPPLTKEQLDVFEAEYLKARGTRRAAR